ncbi:hypothetical protein ACFV2Q_03255 [Streptomyces sp. NPDC059650]|uniref:hypothetical protein n=1 Tax=Streptomyces sp. NPDC059650 TaxID=3346896 RepID=UPI0036B8874E
MSSTVHTHPVGSSTGGCDPGAIDELACTATGIQRRAEVPQEHLPQLREFQEKFNGAGPGTPGPGWPRRRIWTRRPRRSARSASRSAAGSGTSSGTA